MEAQDPHQPHRHHPTNRDLNPNPYATSFAYDPTNRVTTVTAPLARVTRYAYGPDGKVTRATTRRLAARAPARSAPHTAATADVSKARSTAFFWSGVRDEEAVKIARSRGGTTLEDLNRTRGFSMPAWDPYDANVSESWELLSARYAASASGMVRVTTGPGGYADTAWTLLELPTLKTNPEVTQIMQIDPKSGAATTSFSR